ncbi:MAG: polysaccharide deacetylase family protein [Puniceicoccaceae bacterium]
MKTSQMLTSVMYHYVRDVENSRFPGIKGISRQSFRRQIQELSSTYEIADAEKIREFFSGHREPGSRPLCALTFDDGFKEHADFVTEVCVDFGVTGQFYITTACIEEKRVLDVHKNHFLLAAMGVEAYAASVFHILKSEFGIDELPVEPSLVTRHYRWDRPEVARLKYLINYQLEPQLRSRLLALMFTSEFGDESAFASELYVSWEDLKSMKRAGMMIGGHSHRHQVMAELSENACIEDIQSCLGLLRTHIGRDAVNSFAYPYGKPHTIPDGIETVLEQHGIDFAFSTIIGTSAPEDDRYCIRRIDPKDL